MFFWRVEPGRHVSEGCLFVGMEGIPTSLFPRSPYIGIFRGGAPPRSEVCGRGAGNLVFLQLSPWA